MQVVEHLPHGLTTAIMKHSELSVQDLLKQLPTQELRRSALRATCPQIWHTGTFSYEMHADILSVFDQRLLWSCLSTIPELTGLEIGGMLPVAEVESVVEDLVDDIDVHMEELLFSISLRSLRRFTSLQRLDLQGACIKGSAMVAKLGNALARMTGLLHLDLRFNVHQGHRNCNSLVSEFRSLVSLQCLRLRGEMDEGNFAVFGVCRKCRCCRHWI